MKNNKIIIKQVFDRVTLRYVFHSIERSVLRLRDQLMFQTTSVWRLSIRSLSIFTNSLLLLELPVYPCEFHTSVILTESSKPQ